MTGNMSRKSAELALRLNPHVSLDQAAASLLQLAAEAADWSNAQHGRALRLPAGNRDVERLSKGSVDQAATVARSSQDPQLLAAMAKSDKRRTVRAYLSENSLLPPVAAEDLWGKERKDAANTGADLRVVAALLRRFDSEVAVERFCEALTWPVTTGSGNRSMLVESLVDNLVARKRGDLVEPVLATLAKADPVAITASSPVAAKFAPCTTVAVLNGLFPDLRSSWTQVVDKLEPKVAEQCGVAAWTAALTNPELLLDDVWCDLAVRGWSEVDRQHQNPNAWRWELQPGVGNQSVSECLTALFARMPHRMVRELAAVGNASVVAMLVDCAELSVDVLEILFEVNQNHDKVLAASFELVRDARSVDAVKLLARHAAPQPGDLFMTVAGTSVSCWQPVLSTMVLPQELTVQLVNASLVHSWVDGVNRPTTISQWEAVVSRVPEEHAPRWVQQVAALLEWGRLDYNPVLRDHVWSTTAGLAQPLVESYGHGGLIELTARHLEAELGDEADAWNTAVRLLPDFTGRLGDLAALCKVL